MSELYETTEEFDRHPLSAAWGNMEPDQFAELVADIHDNGQRDTVILSEGKVLDGWHRYLACKSDGRATRVQEMDSEANLVAFVVSKNAHRRSQTAGQRAIAIVRCKGWLETGDLNQAPGGHPVTNLTNMQLAEMAGVSVSTLKQARAADRGGLGDEVAQGNISAKEAAETVRQRVWQPRVLRSAQHAAESSSQAVSAATPMERLEAELEEAQTAIAVLTERNTELEGEVSDLRKTLDPDGEALLIAQSSARAEIDSLRSQLAEHQDLNSRLKREVAALRKGARR